MQQNIYQFLTSKFGHSYYFLLVIQHQLTSIQVKQLMSHSIMASSHRRRRVLMMLVSGVGVRSVDWPFDPFIPFYLLTFWPFDLLTLTFVTHDLLTFWLFDFFDLWDLLTYRPLWPIDLSDLLTFKTFWPLWPIDLYDLLTFMTFWPFYWPFNLLTLTFCQFDLLSI